MDIFNGTLSNRNHNQMDEFLGRVLDAHKAGKISRSAAIGGLAHVMAALDKQNTGEAISWFKQKGVVFFRDDAHTE